MVWEELGEMQELARPGEAVHVRGRYTVHPRFGPQINLRGLREPAPGSYAPEDLLDGPAHTPEQLEAQLRELLADRPSAAPARAAGARARARRRAVGGLPSRARRQALPPGLPARPAWSTALSVAQAVSATSATFAGIDRDVAVTGALLHDIGKLEAYADDPRAIDLTDAGRLQGEIALGYYRVRRLIEEIDGFPARAGAGGDPHHPLPSRLARAWKPGRAVHA